jgi:anti-anti-sigma factor
VLLDLSGADFISSSGIGWLITCNKRFKEAGGLLIIHSLVPMVSQMLTLMRLNRVLSITPDLASAKQQIEAAA